jgi:hypothetical protein
MTGMSLQEAAHCLGGRVSGPNQISCPGPGHSRFDYSLAVWINHDGTITVYSHAGDDWRECQNYVRDTLGIPRWEKQSHYRLNSRTAKPKPIFPTGTRSHAFAISIFAEARPLRGTVGEKYLVRRIGREMEWPSDIRFHPACVRKVDGVHQRHPAVIVLLRDIATDDQRAIQRIFLKSDGSDRLRDRYGKMTLGPAAGAVAKLSPDDCVSHGLGIAEGVETGLRVMSLGWKPIWATIGTSTMKTFPVLAGIEALTAFADHDKNGAGENAAQACIVRWLHAGREAQGIKPRTVGLDWADVVHGGAL